MAGCFDCGTKALAVVNLIVDRRQQSTPQT
jgi:hypothetical protein